MSEKRGKIGSYEIVRLLGKGGMSEVYEVAKGRMLMPSRSQFEAARLDALVLTYGTLEALRLGKVTLESAIGRLEAMRESVRDDSDVTPFDGLAIGGGEYMQLGENDALRMLLSKAIEKLRKIED